MRIKPILWGGLALAFTALGCAHKNEVAPVPSPTPPAAAMPAPEASAPAPSPVPTLPPTLHYDVRKGDSLWSIAAKPGVLDDPFRWPLLFKQNRDQIADPDLIDIHQVLDYGAPADGAAVRVAIEEARDTPAYVRHTRARTHLPMRY